MILYLIISLSGGHDREAEELWANKDEALERIEELMAEGEVNMQYHIQAMELRTR